MNVQSRTFLERRHWLCVAYSFPPINRSGTHRTLAFVRHLDAMGWDATVLTSSPGDEPVDAALMDAVPPTTKIIQVPWVDRIVRLKQLVGMTGTTPVESSDVAAQTTPASSASGRTSDRSLRDWLTRLLIIPDSKTGWTRPATQAGRAAIGRRHVDVVYSTSPCISAHLIAATLARKAGAPWVADFRDPWGGNPFRDLRYATHKWLDAWLERRVLRQADHIICNTPTMTRALVERSPDVADKCSTILNGFDPERLDGVVPLRDGPEDTFIITHCGQFYGPRTPQLLLRAARLAVDGCPRLGDRLRLVFVGHEHYAGRPLREWAVDAGVGRLVEVLGPRSHGEALARVAGSDAVLLAGSIGSGAELQVPGKLFEYLSFRRPILAACPRSSPVVDILRDARADAVVVEPDDVRGLADTITRLAEGTHVAPLEAWSGVEAFARFHRANELAGIFERLTGVELCRGSVFTIRTPGHQREKSQRLGTKEQSMGEVVVS